MPVGGWAGPAESIVEITSTAAGSGEPPAGDSALSAARSHPSSRARPRYRYPVSPPLIRIFHRTNPVNNRLSVASMAMSNSQAAGVFDQCESFGVSGPGTREVRSTVAADPAKPQRAGVNQDSGSSSSDWHTSAPMAIRTQLDQMTTAE